VSERIVGRIGRRIRLLVLSVPRRELTWILEPVQIDGEPFTMGGTNVRIERLPPPEPEEALEDGEEKPQEPAKVITFPNSGDRN